MTTVERNNEDRVRALPTHAPQPVFDALRSRRSHSKVTDEAPTREEIARLLETMASIADHSSMRPWRVIEIRGKARDTLGKALAKGNGTSKVKGIEKAHRAPLILAVVASPKISKKVPYWEQEAVATGVAHALSLLLHEAGWGVMWRTGLVARHRAVRKAMRLERREQLVAWLYVGGIPERDQKPKPRKPLELSRHLSGL